MKPRDIFEKKPIEDSINPTSPAIPEKKTEWVSLAIASSVTFFCAVQFTIYFASIWPYLLQLDPDITEEFYGYINAVYSLAQAISCPLFGWLANRMGQSRAPILSGIILMTLGNMFYIATEASPYSAKWCMFVARSITGFGAGIIAVLRNYSVTASTIEDRSRSIALNSGAFALGLTAGPTIQIIFNPISYPGFHRVGGLGIDMYTAPAYLGIILNVGCFLSVLFFFRESTVGIKAKVTTENEEHARFFALPKFDMIGVFVCIVTRFAQMFVITNLETIGGPLTMTMFSWNKQETVRYNSIMHGGFGILSFGIYVVSVKYNLGKRINHRVGTIFGLIGLVIFHLLTFPWWGLSRKIEYQQEYIEINGTTVKNPDPLGCKPSFEWCSYTPRINEYLYVISYMTICGLSFSLINISMNTVYSTVIGPRNQGTWQGILLLSGSIARMCGPIFVSNLFTAYGPRPTWAMEIFFAGTAAALWIVFYHRLVPLRLPETLKQGESYKSKHGPVYKF